MLLKFPVHGMGKLWLRYSNSYGKTLHVDKAFKTSSESRYQNSIKQNEIVGRILSGSQVISLCHHIVNLFKHLSILENIILRYLFLIFILSLHWQLNSITLQSHSSQHNILIIGPCYCPCWPCYCPAVVVSPSPKRKRAFSVGDDFLNQHWSI